MLGSEENKVCLQDFLECVLDIPTDRIEGLELLDKELAKDTISDKTGILDVKLRLKDGTTIDIPACPERDIAASATAESIRSGSALPVALTLENRGNVACSTSLTRFSLRVTTGDQTVYNSASCADSQQASTTLLLRPAASWTGSLTWDGRVYADGCTAPTGGASPAPAGTYKLALVMDGREVGSTVVDVAPAPTPAPTPQSGAQSGSQSGAQSGR